MNLPNTSSHPILEFVKKIQAKTQVPQIAVGILTNSNSQIFGVDGSGKAKFDSVDCQLRFESTSVARLLLAVSAIHLANRGALDLDVSISTYLTELTSCAARNITLLHLLSHTSGLLGPNFSDLDVIVSYSWDELVNLVNANEKLFPPGRLFNPIHIEYVIVGELLKRITGTDPLEYAIDLVFGSGYSQVCKSRSFDNNLVPLQTFDLSTRSFRIAERAFEWSIFWACSAKSLQFTISEYLEIGNFMLNGSQITNDHSVFDVSIRLPTLISGLRSDVVPQKMCSGIAGFYDGIYGPISMNTIDAVTIRYLLDRKTVAIVGCCWDKQLIRTTIMDRIAEDSGVSIDKPILTKFYCAFKNHELAGTYTSSEYSTLEVMEVDSYLVVRSGKNPCVPEAYANFEIRLARVSEFELEPVGRMLDVSIAIVSSTYSSIPCIVKGMNSYIKNV